jgi:hypothetical protein
MKPAIKPTELDMPNEVEELCLGIRFASQAKDDDDEDDDDGSIDAEDDEDID